MKKTIFLALIALFLKSAIGFSQEKIHFKSLDSLLITADWYELTPTSPVILLCHQARSSRGEYANIAPKLNELGYSCLAIDQRSGAKMQGVVNETNKLAHSKKLDVQYLDAEQDIISAINFLDTTYKKPIILFGSSYSASLALKIGNTDDRISVVIAFSPGEHFAKKLDVANAMDGFNKPLFITSSLPEARVIQNMIGHLKLDFSKLYHFIPKANGVHGARALFKSNPNHEEYWNALKNFLQKQNPIQENSD